MTRSWFYKQSTPWPEQAVNFNGRKFRWQGTASGSTSLALHHLPRQGTTSERLLTERRRLTREAICQEKKSEVKVEICLVEGKDKGQVIVEAAKNQGVALLVLGSRNKRSMMVLWRLFMSWRGRGSGGRGAVVDYCIKNASCMAVGVRRRGKRSGGYLITTMKHKAFWLLASSPRHIMNK